MATRKQNAQRELGAKPESLGQAESTGDDSTTIGKQFNAGVFAGDVATLHMALLNLATGHALTTSPAVLHFAGRGVALAYLAAGGVL